MTTADELAQVIRRLVNESVDERMDKERSVGVSVPEAAKILGVSVTTVWRKIRAGEIETERVLGHVRISQDEIDRILEGR